MARLADGDPGAFDPVFDALWPVLRAYCLKSLARSADAEDAAQRALLKMLENAPRYDRSRPAVAWALAFAAWECRSERTRQRRARTAPETEAATDSTPESLALRKEQQLLLESVLSELSEQERALVLRESNADLALAPATARKRRQRLLEKLRGMLRLLIDPNGAAR
jgi:RNA polymerase sigma-70 factor (ECF subfamily)